MPPQVIPVDSNSTRTESSVAIRPDPIARVPVDVPKAADHNGYQQITRPSREMEAGLKILVSAVQSRPSPPFISDSCPSGILLRDEFVPRFVPNSGAFQRIREHSRRQDQIDGLVRPRPRMPHAFWNNMIGAE